MWFAIVRARLLLVHIVVMKFSDDNEVALLVWLTSRAADDFGRSLTLRARERRTAKIMAAAKRRGYRGRSVDAACAFLTKMLLPRKVLLPVPT
jgi:hypothetical protein